MIEGKDIILPLSVDILQSDTQTRELLDILDREYLYHNYSLNPSRHTLRALASASILTRAEGVDRHTAELTKIGSLLHDIGHASGGSADHEERGAELSGKILKRFGLDPHSIETVQEGILSTHGKLIDGAYITTPQTIEQKILCDADMNLAGESPAVFQQMGDLLRQEIGVDDIDRWNRSQLAFLKGIRWHTQGAFQLWEPQRQMNITAMEQLIST